MDADPLPRCPHGKNAIVTDREYPRRTIYIDTDGPCDCAVAADTPDRARRAWVALCGED